MKLLHSILKAILYKPVKRVRLLEILENLGCEIKDKRPSKSVDEITAFMFPNGGIYSEDNGLIRIDNSEKVFNPKSRIDAAINALRNYDKARVTEINTHEDAEQYINRKKDIEGITPVKLWTKQREWKEKNTPHVKN